MRRALTQWLHQREHLRRGEVINMKSKPSKINFFLSTDKIKEHRYCSIDDWQDPKIVGDYVHFLTQTADTGNRKYNFLILIHALVEQYLCYEKGITDKEVTRFDKEHTHCFNPGEHDQAPYHFQHLIANDVESLIANALNIDWTKYEDQIDKTLRKWKKDK